MIASVSGVLKDVAAGKVWLTMPGGLVIEALVPGYAAARLGGSIGQAVTLETLLFLESSNQGASFSPRLAAFATAEDKAFYELLVTVKGIGQRKALRAMALPAAQIAAAIADRDTKTLQTLPEVGKRTAETIVVELKGKVDAFLAGAAVVAGGSGEAVSAGGSGGGGVVREALQTLVTLGENRVAAAAWIDRVMQGDDPPGDAGALVAAAFRVKQSGG